MTKKKSNPPSEEVEEEEQPRLSLFGKFLIFLYETTFVVVIVLFGTLIGTLLGILMPVGFPMLILWKRYVDGHNKKTLKEVLDG